MKRISFNEDWNYQCKGEAARNVRLPHDASIERGRDPKAASGRSGAFFKSGFYTYTKKMDIPVDWKDKALYLEFEGVYPNAAVYLNGRKIGGCQYGYSTFLIELSDFQAGEENEIRVEVDDTKHPNSRWYAGAGIYRPVWLLVGEKSHIAPHGIRITTESYAPAEISVDVAVGEENAKERILVDIYEGDYLLMSAEGAHCKLQIPNAKLWSAEEPNLYRCRVRLLEQDVLCDESWEYFGIRKLEWNAKKGFLINGQKTLLKGGCIHHDNGILGARSYAQAEWRRIARLKEFGYNAIRSAHNPISRATLEACDALGMYVLDEAWDTWYQAKNPYDCSVGFEEHYEADLQQMVDKDYNHPSVIMYSIGNEVTEPAKKQGLVMEQKLVETVKRLDSTRPVTVGMNVTLLLMAKLPFDPSALFSGGEKKEEEETEQPKENKTMSSDKYNQMVQQAGTVMTRVNQGLLGDLASKKVMNALDIAGYNYGVNRYERDQKKWPDRVIVGTETFCQDIGKIWPKIEKMPHVIGDFMWTAWDYLGEAGIGGYSYDKEDFVFEKAYPWKLADAGALDILGNDTAEAGLAKVVFTGQMQPYIGVTPANHGGRELARAAWRGTNARPHWSYQGCDGAMVTVEIYSAASEVELFINEKSQGRKKLEDFQASYEVAYESGSIRAVAYDAQKNAVGESSLTSAAGQIRLAITQEKDFLPAREDTMLSSCEKERIVYLDLALVGENGKIECNADRLLEVAVEGGRLLAFGSANPKTEDDYLTGKYHTYFGRGQAVIALSKESKQAKISICGEGMEKTAYEIK